MNVLVTTCRIHNEVSPFSRVYRFAHGYLRVNKVISWSYLYLERHWSQVPGANVDAVQPIEPLLMVLGDHLCKDERQSY